MGAEEARIEALNINQDISSDYPHEDTDGLSIVSKNSSPPRENANNNASAAAQSHCSARPAKPTDPAGTAAGCGPLATVPAAVQFCDHLYTGWEVIGEGTFSTVYGATCRATGNRLAIKAITCTTAPQRLLVELEILRRLGGLHQCMPLLQVHRARDQILAVFPRVPATDFSNILAACTPAIIRSYMRGLLTAVCHMHAHGVVHRDIKPSNFLFDTATDSGYLIDFGLAFIPRPAPPAEAEPEARQPLIFFNSIVVPSKPPGYYANDTRRPMKAPRAGTRGFRAPEVLFKSQKQLQPLDVWSAGVILLCLLTRRYPFFQSIDDTDALVELATIFGHAEMRRAAKLYGRTWKCNIPSVSEDGIAFERLIAQLAPDSVVDPLAVDLLRGMLDLDCDARLTAADALAHQYLN